MSFLSSFLNIFSVFTVAIQNGFSYLPAQGIANGAAFTDMLNAVNFINAAGNFFTGNAFGSTSVLAQPSFTQQPPYQPQQTTPPVAFPTSQQGGYVVPTGLNMPNMYQTSSEGIRVIKTFEGLHQRPYLINGQKYIGYGHQLAATDTTSYISIDQANAFLASDVQAAEGMVKGAISTKITQTQFDAMVDFAFTTTGANFSGSQVVSALNSGDVAGACTALMQWVYGNQNNVLAKFPHLVSRRTQNVHWLSMNALVAPPS